MKEIIFKCPKCGLSGIEEIQVGVTVTTRVVSLEESDGTTPARLTMAEMEYGKQTNTDGYVDRYQCSHCGYIIVDSSCGELDNRVLAKALTKLNTGETEVTFDELVTRIADQYSALSGEELAEIWNSLFPEQVVYKGDSMYWVAE